MPQRAIRFPDDLHDRIVAEVERLGHPHTFSSFVVNASESALSAAETPSDSAASQLRAIASVTRPGYPPENAAEIVAEAHFIATAAETREAPRETPRDLRTPVGDGLYRQASWRTGPTGR